MLSSLSTVAMFGLRMPSYLISTFCCCSSTALIIRFICSHRPGFFVVFVVRSTCAPFRLHGYHIGRRTYHQRVRRPFACLALPSSFCWLVNHFELAHGAQFHTTCVYLRPTLTAFPLQSLLKTVMFATGGICAHVFPMSFRQCSYYNSSSYRFLCR